MDSRGARSRRRGGWGIAAGAHGRAEEELSGPLQQAVDDDLINLLRELPG